MKDCSLSPSLAVTFGREPHEFLKLRVLGPGNGAWLPCRVAIGQNGLAGSFDLQLQCKDFELLCKGIRKLYSSLIGEASFQPIERQIEFELKGDGRGHISLQGEAIFSFEHGPWVKFRIELDQTELPAIVEQLKGITDKFG